jgi:hypothetical protein
MREILAGAFSAKSGKRAVPVNTIMLGQAKMPE